MAKKIKIKDGFRCESVYSEINWLITHILKIRKDAKNEEGYLYHYNVLKDFEGLKLVLINIMYEKTNIMKVLKENKYYLNTHDLDKAFKGLDTKSSDPLYERLFSNINQLLEVEDNLFLYLFPLNLVFDNENNTQLNEILELFNIKKIETNDVKNILDENIVKQQKEVKNENSIDQRFISLLKKNKPEKKDVFNYLKKYPTILLLKDKGKNSGFSNRSAIYQIESFLGFLSFSKNYLKQNLFLFENFRGNNNYNEIRYDEVVIIRNNRINWPNKDIIDKLHNETQRNRLVNFDSFEYLVNMYEDIKTIKNDALWDLLEKSYFLYFKASSEERIEYSFLNYWILAETLIKGNGRAKSNEEIKAIMKSVIGDKIIKKRVDFLDKKRNHLVHKGEIVTVGERDLIKIIADLLLAESMRIMGKLKNDKQFVYYLSNIKTSKKDRENYSEVLNILSEQNSTNNPK